MNRYIAGQSVLEILIAIAVFVISLAAGFQLFFGGQTLSSDSANARLASDYAREGTEAVQSIRNRNWNELTPGAHGLILQNNYWMFGSSTSSDTKDIFVRTVSIGTTTDSFIKIATTSITWQTDPLRPQKIELVEKLTNWREALNLGGDTGGGGTTGNWQNPQTLGKIDLGAGNSGTDLDVLNKYVYITADASDSKKKDFYIVDVTDGQNPAVLSSIDVGQGLLSIDVANTYAYVGSKDTGKQLQIIDVSNKNNPILTTSYQLPNVSGGGAIGQSIFFYKNKVYIGTKTATGPEFHIIDVSDPANPSELVSKELGADVNAIVVSGDYAYLATSDNSKELQIFYVGDPSNITLVGSFNAPGNSDGKSLYLVGNTLYFGRLEGDSPDFYIFDVSNPSSIQVLGSKTIGDDINDLRVRDSFAFLATSDSNREFQVWNISNPSNITLWSSFNFPQVASGIDYEDNIVYVAVRSNDALRIITSQ